MNKGKRKYESDCATESCLRNVKRKYETIVISSDLQTDETCSRFFTGELGSDLKSLKNSVSDCSSRQLNTGVSSSLLNASFCGRGPGHQEKNNDLLVNSQLSSNETAIKQKSSTVLLVGREGDLNGRNHKRHSGFAGPSVEQNYLDDPDLDITNRKVKGDRMSNGQRMSTDDHTKKRPENASSDHTNSSTDLAPIIAPNGFSDLNFNLSNCLAAINPKLDSPIRIKLNELDANRFAPDSIDRPNKLDESKLANRNRLEAVGENKANESELGKLNRNKLGENVDRPTPVTEVTLELNDDYLLRTPSSPVASNALQFVNCTRFLNALDSSNADEASVQCNSLDRCSVRKEFKRLNSVQGEEDSAMPSHWNCYSHLSDIYFEKLYEHFKGPHVNVGSVASLGSSRSASRLEHTDRVAELQANFRDDISAMECIKSRGLTSSVDNHDGQEFGWLSSSPGGILENNSKNSFKDNLNLLLENIQSILKTGDQRHLENASSASPKVSELFTDVRKDRPRINPKRTNKSESKQGGYQCQECKKVFRRNSTLSTHKLIHTNTRPFRCPYCNKGELHAYG